MYLPAPKTLAVLDSLLYTVADDLVPAAASATFATASDGEGVIMLRRGSKKNMRTRETTVQNKWVSMNENLKLEIRPSTTPAKKVRRRSELGARKLRQATTQVSGVVQISLDFTSTSGPL